MNFSHSKSWRYILKWHLQAEDYGDKEVWQFGAVIQVVQIYQQGDFNISWKTPCKHYFCLNHPLRPPALTTTDTTTTPALSYPHFMPIGEVWRRPWGRKGLCKRTPLSIQDCADNNIHLVWSNGHLAKSNTWSITLTIVSLQDLFLASTILRHRTTCLHWTHFLVPLWHRESVL